MKLLYESVGELQGSSECIEKITEEEIINILINKRKKKEQTEKFTGKIKKETYNKYKSKLIEKLQKT